MRRLLLTLLGVCVVSAFVANFDTEKVFRHQITPAATRLTGKSLVDYVNRVQNFYKAELKPISKEQMKSRLMSKKFLGRKTGLPSMPGNNNVAAVPDSFDSRTQWPSCPSMSQIRDQSMCGSCWAFAAAEAMSDRTCIAAKQASNPILSADDLLSCCGDQCGYGCEGGYPIEAWNYWVSDGLVTGGLYGDNTTCRPYEISPCGYHKDEPYYRDCPPTEDPTPQCVKQCQAGYPTDYASDKHKGKSAYYVDPNAAAIQNDIMTNGPVEAAFTVYEDFYHYTTGVYVHTAGQELGGHAVKILGWGVDGSTPYWLIANSWNNDWGENGYFRMIRGTNDCGIEAEVVAGLAA